MSRLARLFEFDGGDEVLGAGVLNLESSDLVVLPTCQLDPVTLPFAPWVTGGWNAMIFLPSSRIVARCDFGESHSGRCGGVIRIVLIEVQFAIVVASHIEAVLSCCWGLEPTVEGVAMAITRVEVSLDLEVSGERFHFRVRIIDQA